MTGLLIMLGAILATLIVAGLFIVVVAENLRRVAVAIETIANLSVRQAQVLEAQLEAFDRGSPVARRMFEEDQDR